MRIDILKFVWDHTIEGNALPWLASIDPVTRQFKNWTADLGIPASEQGRDIYWTPMCFEGDRSNASAVKLSVLFADLDNFYEMEGIDPWPHIMWTTSNDNAQAIWLLEEPLPLDEWSDLNQRLTYYLGADKGGWHASKLLRIPETLNHKYSPPQLGEVHHFHNIGRPYAVEALQELPPVLKSETVGTEAPVPLERGEWKRHLAKLWPSLPLKLRSDLLAPGVKDRSLKIIHTVNDMRRLEIDREDIFHALWWCAWNKWRTDRNSPQMLWDIVLNSD